MKKTFLFTIMMLLTIWSVRAQFGGGTGTSGDPYQISTAAHMATLATNVNGGTNYLGVYFKMMNDISLSSYDNWTPIGNSSYYFMGSFDGNSKKITGLKITSTTTHRGLFGFLYNGATIKDLTIENCDIMGINRTGALVGEAWVAATPGSITISNCQVSGAINWYGTYVGGLIGRVYNASTSGAEPRITISNCSSSVTVSSQNNAAVVGGLIGDATSTNTTTMNVHISNCFSSGSVSTTGSGSESLGGLLGYGYYSSLTNCYSTSSVNAPRSNDYGGGFIGMSIYCAIANCYSAGSVTGTSVNVLGFCGYSVSSTMTGCYWDFDVSTKSTSAGGSGVVGMNTWNMKRQGLYSGWDFTNVWRLNPTVKSSYPVLAWEGYSSYASQPAGGNGTSGSPYQIGTLSQLYWIDQNPAQWDKYYIQSADIDASATSAWENNKGWMAIGKGSGSGFTGSYNGQGLTISGLTIVRSTTDDLGLFGYTFGATISNVKLTGVNFTGQHRTAGLVGYNNNSTISNCSSQGNITGGSWSGGLVGYDYSTCTISNCFSTGSVTGNSTVGGLVGGMHSGATIITSYSTASVSGAVTCGGMVGWVNNSTVMNCYSKGNVTRSSGSAPDVGGFAGYNQSGKITNCYSTGTVKDGGGSNIAGKGFTGGTQTGGIYEMSGNFWDTETSQQTSSAGVATGKTTAEMKTLATFTSAGWDFVYETTNGTNNYWDMDGDMNVDNGYPFFSWQETAMIWTGASNSNWTTPANWSGSLDMPTAYKNIIIPSGAVRGLTLNTLPASPATCNNFTIAAGAQNVIIAPGKALTVNGVLTNNNGSSGLYLQSDENGTGSLLHSSSGVPAIVETYISGSASLSAKKYHFVSIPALVAGPTSNLFLDCYLYKLDPSQQEVTNSNYYGKWMSLGISTTTPLNLNEGYMVYYPYDIGGTYPFFGNLNNSDFSCAIAGHTGTYTFNLVPNPYPSAINWKTGTGWARSAGVGGSCYVWSATDGNYVTLSSLTDNYITVGQAFVVMVSDEASPSLTIKNAARAHSTQAFYKSTQEISNQLSIKADANGYSDVTRIAFNDEATDDFDLQMDGMKMFGLEDAPQLYTLSGDKQFSINNLPGFQDQRTVDMNFETSFTGEVTLIFDGLGSFNPSINIYLKDELTGQTINLRSQHVYTFIHNPENAANRFKLVFGGTIGINETSPDAGKIWIAGITLHINATEMAGQQALIEVFNPAGQRILAKPLVLEDFTTFELNLKGFVIVKLTSGQKILTTKGIIMN